MAMIKRIHTIKGLGVYKDFNWNREPSPRDLNDKNIIYGWNYSGKTTLSRIFSSLRDKKLHKDYTDCSFTLTLNDGTEFNSTDIENSSFKVAVFNKEYIDENLLWDSMTSFGEPIAFDVGENVVIRQEISKLESKMDRVLLRKEVHIPIINRFKDFDNYKFTNKAREISLIVFGAERQFDKRGINSVLTEFGDTPILDNQIVSDSKELEALKSTAIAKNNLQEINKVEFSLKFEELRKLVESILTEEPPKDVLIDILEKNKVLYDWVKSGTEFEENKENCSFCGNPVGEKRLSDLTNYFSNASKDLRDGITTLKQQIESEKVIVQNCSIPSNELLFIDTIKEDARRKLNEFFAIRDSYIKGLDFLRSELDRKEDGNIFNSIELGNSSFSEIGLTDWRTEINSLIDRHNSFIENFETNQQETRKKLKKHLIADFLKSENYFEKKEQAEKSECRIEIMDALYKRFENEKNEKQDSLRTITKGKEELNKFIKKFLNREDIKIDVTSDDKFQLFRGSQVAINLSEGEKTAIAFSYFLVYLESIGMTDIQKYIIYIDDPISSLDNNHIAQVYSLINSFFFRKGVDQSNQDRVVNCFSQLFISTHNFEFFSFLKDSSQLKRKKKIVDANGAKTEVPSCSYYFIRKLTGDESTISDLPISLSRYKSEYIYLFKLIYDYHDKKQRGEDTDEILIPNALRRFLEIYTLMKIPSEPDSVENRINELVDDVNQFKLLNHFSHFTTFEKATRHDELIMILPDACNQLFDLLDKDQTHYLSLKKSIGIN